MWDFDLIKKLTHLIPTISYRKTVTGKARLYLYGIVRNGIRKNMSQIAQRVPNASPDNLQHFISDSK